MSRTIKKTIIRKIKKKLVIPKEKQRMTTQLKVKNKLKQKVQIKKMK